MRQKFFVTVLMMSALAVPAMAMDTMAPVTATTATATVAPAVSAAATTTNANTVTTTVETAADAVPMPAMPDAAVMTPVVAPAPVLGAVPSALGTTTTTPAVAPVIGANQTAAEMPPMSTSPVMAPVEPTPAIVSPLPPLDGQASVASSLCAPVVAVPVAGVEMAPAQPVVSAPRTIPLSVDLAGALGIRGFENIKSEGPIGYITMDANGKAMFEGKEITGNVQTLCASGLPIPAAGMNAPVATAPDGSAYSAMPGQGGSWKMQPIIDGPNYKYPPKKKKKAAAPKVEATVKEENLAPVTEGKPSAAETPATSDVDTLKTMMREPATAEAPAVEVPASTGVVPMPAEVPANITTDPTLDTSGEGAVGEVLGEKPAAK